MKRMATLAGLAVAGYWAYRLLKPRYNFRGKHVVITGGSRGLGLVLAREFAAAGARLSLCSRDADELSRAKDDLAHFSVPVATFTCDITDRGQVRKFFSSAREANGSVDVLVNNAGIIQVGPVEEMRTEDFEQSLQTHFWGPLAMIDEVLPEMKARRAGRIVNIASIGGKIAIPHLLPYSAGKFSLVGLSNGLRVELIQHGITVTTVCPGLMRTGSHLNAQFKGQHEAEYAWFATGNSIPGFSMNAERAARKIIDACAAGDAEVVLGLPAKVAVAAHALAPNLTADLLALVDRLILPAPGGIGPAMRSGHESRGRLPAVVTTLTDRAAAANNES